MSQTPLKAIRLRLPEVTDDSRDALLTALYADAGDMIRAMTWRDAVPDALLGAQARLAVVLYSRVGMEGDASRREGDVSREIEKGIPDDLRREIYAYRAAAT